MVRLWNYWRGGLGLSARMPDPGGLLDQPAAMVEAFDVMSAAAAELDKESRGK